MALGTTHKLNICYLLPSMNLGGTERHVLALASAFRRRGHNARILTLFSEGSLAEEIRKEGIPLECLNRSGGWSLAIFWNLFRWLSDNPVDILHTCLSGFHFFAGLPARMANIPVVLSSRRELASWKKVRHRWLENLGNLFTDGVVCNSQAVRRWTMDNEIVSSRKVSTIHNGIASEHWKGIQERSRIREELGLSLEVSVVGTVANFGQEKGYPYLLEAAQIVLKESPSAHFLIVGSGPLDGEIKMKAQTMKDRGRIHFTGARSDVPELLSAMDVFVLASTSEGLPNVILEAMAAAKPIVATQVGGIPELIRSGREGLLVPSGDPRALAEAVLCFLKDGEVSKAMGEEARRRVKKDFELAGMVDQYQELYLNLWNS